MNQAVRKGRAVLVELYTRIIKSVKDKDTEVYWNGENNHYPSEIERVVNSSPTAKRAAKIMAKFIAGKGLRNEAQDIIVNEKKNYRLSNIAHLAAEDVAEQGGAWLELPATLLLAVTSLLILGLTLGTWRGLRHGHLLVPDK